MAKFRLKVNFRTPKATQTLNQVRKQKDHLLRKNILNLHFISFLICTYPEYVMQVRGLHYKYSNDGVRSGWNSPSFKITLALVYFKPLLKLTESKQLPTFFTLRNVTESSEDEDAKELTEEVEKDFFRTLAMLKSKNPQIYDGKTTFFAAKKDDDIEEEPKKKVKKEKALTIADLERKVMLEKGGKFEEMDEFRPSTRFEYFPQTIMTWKPFRITLAVVFHKRRADHQ